MRQKVSDEQVLDAYAAARSIQEASELLGIHRSTLQERLRKLGILTKRHIPRRFHLRRVTDQEILDAYHSTGSVWKAAKKLGLCGQSVHERLQKLGVPLNKNFFTAEELEFLRSHYNTYADEERLDELAQKMKRKKTVVCAKAKKMGLTNQSRRKLKTGKWKYMSETEASKFFERFKKTSLTLAQFCRKYNYSVQGFSRAMRRFFPDEWDAVIEAKTPKQTFYRLGRAFEYRVKDYLEKKGFFVMRSPRSKSPVDLVAIKTGVVLMIQCKKSGTLRPEEWGELYNVASSVGATPLVAYMPGVRGITFKKLTGYKKFGKRQPPWEEFQI